MVGTCNTCKKEDATKRCASCKSVQYCSRNCQKADWKAHRQTCKNVTAENMMGNSNLINDLANISIVTPELFLEQLGDPADKKRWSSGLNKRRCFERLIDAYRLRLEDDYVFQGDLRGLYAQEDPNFDFRKFLNRAHRRGVLPSWWTAENDVELVNMANKDKRHNIHYAVEKSDIVEHYGYASMEHMVLRSIAEHVYGKNVHGEPV